MIATLTSNERRADDARHSGDDESRTGRGLGGRRRCFQSIEIEFALGKSLQGSVRCQKPACAQISVLKLDSDFTSQ